LNITHELSTPYNFKMQPNPEIWSYTTTQFKEMLVTGIMNSLEFTEIRPLLAHLHILFS